MNLNKTKTIIAAAREHLRKTAPHANFDHVDLIIRYTSPDHYIGDCEVDKKTGRRKVSHKYMRENYPHMTNIEIIMRHGNADYVMSDLHFQKNSGNVYTKAECVAIAKEELAKLSK